MSLTDEGWKDCFGIKGLTLSEVKFTGILSEASSTSDIYLQLEAALQLNNTMVRTSGSYSKGMPFVIRVQTILYIGQTVSRIDDYSLQA